MAVLSRQSHVCPCACIRFTFVTSININDTTDNVVSDAENKIDNSVQISDADKFM